MRRIGRGTALEGSEDVEEHTEKLWISLLEASSPHSVPLTMKCFGLTNSSVDGFRNTHLRLRNENDCNFIPGIRNDFGLDHFFRAISRVRTSLVP
jgi:hypothetical protein